MNFKVSHLVLLFLGMSVLSSCKKDFKSINSNPNAPAEVQAELLLRQVIYNYGEEMSYEGFVAGNLLAQHFTMVDFNLFDRHSLSDPQLGGNPWPVFYSNLNDNEILLSQAQTNSEELVYKGPALILKALMTAALTDIYGDVPYREAFRGAEGIFTPAYDGQDSIYLGQDGIIDNIDQGIKALEDYTGPFALKGDILFNGDLSAWIRFGNSLKIKCLMRISNRIGVGAMLQKIYVEENYVMESSQNASFDFAAGRPNSFRMQQLRDGDFNLFILSQTMEKILKKNNDPRIDVLFQPVASDDSGTTFHGLLNGPDASSTSISVADYSLTGTIFRTNTQDLDANFMTAWESNFLLAEAAERGIIFAPAKTLYDKAVGQAFEYWNTSLPTNYLISDSAAYGLFGQDPIEQILTQKWIANSINGYEGWIEFRRTGFPKLKSVSASLNGGLFPRRMPYPTDEAALNPVNYNRATKLNGNSINAKVWWDL